MPDAPQQHAAGIIPVYPGGAILLQLRDDRPDVAAPNCWSTIGGHVEPGETPEQAAIREMEEEIGRRPDGIISAGHHDHASSRTPGITVRSHIFGTAACWPLDDLILGEGQRLDWFTPTEVPHLPLAPALAPAILAFLASELHRVLSGPRQPVKPPLAEPLPEYLSAMLGLRPSRLLAVEGIAAGFVHRLAALPHGARITASLGRAERPDTVLWQPRGGTIAPVLRAWHPRLAPDGRLVVVGSASHLAAVRAQARCAGFTDGEPCDLPDLPPALLLRPAPRP